MFSLDFCVLFGFFVSYLDIFGRFLDFLCPIWGSYLEIFSRFMEILYHFPGDFQSFLEMNVADLQDSWQGTGQQAGKRAAP